MQVIGIHTFSKHSIKRLIVTILRFFVGSVFIFSAISKLFPIELFELTFVYQGIASWQVAPYLSKLLIGFELFIGIALIFNQLIKKLIIPITFLLLITFTIYLFYVLFKYGNTTDCGCFGSLFHLTAKQSIIKNIILIIAIIIIYRYSEITKWKYKWLLPSVFVVCISIFFILFPVEKYIVHPIEYKSKMPAWFADITNFEKDKNADFKQGRKIVAFFSLTCEHCKELAFKLGILQKNNKLPPTYFVFYGNKKNVPAFFAQTKSNFPYKVLNDEDFYSYAGPTVPKIFLLQDGLILMEWTTKLFDAEKFEDQLK